MAVASLATLLRIQTDISYNTRQLDNLTLEMDANKAKLEEQEKWYNKWEKAFDDAQDEDKTCKIGNTTWKEKGVVLSDAKADAYAHAKVKKYDEDLLDELTELDMDYDSRKTILEATLTELNAEKDSWKQETSTELSDTHVLGQ